MTYKFVSREEVATAIRIKNMPYLLRVLEPLMAERDAYREVAIQNSYQGVDIETSSVIGLIDAEAARIMGGE